jgi:hypothetical protein
MQNNWSSARLKYKITAKKKKLTCTFINTIVLAAKCVLG